MTEATPVVVIDDDVAFADALGLAISLTPHLDVAGHFARPVGEIAGHVGAADASRAG